MQAIWNQKVIADSNNTVVVEGNHYFPPEALNRQYFAASEQTSQCIWKGEASYYDVVVDGQKNPAAAWYYPKPKTRAAEIQGYVAFWKGIEVR